MCPVALGADEASLDDFNPRLIPQTHAHHLRSLFRCHDTAPSRWPFTPCEQQLVLHPPFSDLLFELHQELFESPPTQHRSAQELPSARRPFKEAVTTPRRHLKSFRRGRKTPHPSITQPKHQPRGGKCYKQEFYIDQNTRLTRHNQVRSRV